MKPIFLPASIVDDLAEIVVRRWLIAPHPDPRTAEPYSVTVRVDGNMTRN
jgi:hypothetical protein